MAKDLMIWKSHFEKMTYINIIDFAPLIINVLLYGPLLQYKKTYMNNGIYFLALYVLFIPTGHNSGYFLECFSLQFTCFTTGCFF